MPLVAGVEVGSVFVSIVGMVVVTPAGGLRSEVMLEIFERASDVVSWIGGSGSDAGPSPTLGVAASCASGASAPASVRIFSSANFG